MNRYGILLVLLLVFPVLTGFMETRYDVLDVNSMEEFSSLYEEQRLDVTDQMSVNYVRAGDGYPVIFLHGMGGDHHQWNLNLPHFEEHFSIYALDFPGHGKTGFDAGYPYSITNHADVVLDLMDAENLDRAILIGNSMGGHVALHLAVHHPDRVKRMVLISPSGGAPLGSLDYHIFRSLARHLPLNWVDERILRWRVRMMVQQNRDHEILEDYVKKLLYLIRSDLERPLFEEALREISLSILESNLHTRVPEIEHPTLIVWGENDRVLDLTYGLQLHNNLRTSTLRVFPDTGHLGAFERPDWFHEQVDFFLRDLIKQSEG